MLQCSRCIIESPRKPRSRFNKLFNGFVPLHDIAAHIDTCHTVPAIPQNAPTGVK